MLTVLIGFQNCSKSDSSGELVAVEASKNQWSSRNGNGDGYLKADGTYINTASQGQCSGDDVASVVVVEKGRAMLVKENCQEITPREITSNVEAREYNPEVLFFTNKLFERKPTNNSAFSEVVCRGVAQTDPDGTISYADVSLAPTGETKVFQARTVAVYKGLIKTGSYTALNQLIFAQEEAVEMVFKDMVTSPTGQKRVIYRFFKKVDKRSAMSVADQLREQDSYQLIVMDPKGEFYYVSETSGIHFSIRNMSCYHH